MKANRQEWTIDGRSLVCAYDRRDDGQRYSIMAVAGGRWMSRLGAGLIGLLSEPFDSPIDALQFVEREIAKYEKAKKQRERRAARKAVKK